jgi:hypothetical protein
MPVPRAGWVDGDLGVGRGSFAGNVFPNVQETAHCFEKHGNEQMKNFENCPESTFKTGHDFQRDKGCHFVPAPVCPKTKLSGRKSCPKGPARTESMVPGSRSIKMARGLSHRRNNCTVATGFRKRPLCKKSLLAIRGPVTNKTHIV